MKGLHYTIPNSEIGREFVNHPTVLIIDDDSLFHMAVKAALKGQYVCKSAYNSDEAIAILRTQKFDAALLDIQMRTDDEGLRCLPLLQETDPDLAIIMSSGLTDVQTVKNAMKLGATDYVAKDFTTDELQITLSQALSKRDLLKRRQQQNFEASTAQARSVLIGDSAQMKGLRALIERMRSSNANVVITGETGAGKEVVARQLRKALADGSLEPFVAIDSSTIQSTMAESLLFGHEKGAFTGAERSTRGIFEEANGGVVYFDEISNMPLEIQSKLLRVIQEKEITRLGSTRPIQLDFRVICATNQSLESMAEQGRFKADLFQRLNVLPLAIPPLRERAEDIPLLLEHFLRVQGRAGEGKSFAPEAVTLLQSYAWPGNVRELSNLVAYVLTMAPSDEIEISDLPHKFRQLPRPGEPERAMVGDLSFYDQVSEFERVLLTEEYRKQSGNISKLALMLGMDRSHLYSKLREYRLHVPTSRRPEGAKPSL